MSWEPKAGTPVTFSEDQEFIALITGDANWSWLAQWESLLGNNIFNTADFCHAGPPTTIAPLTLDDFLTSWQNPLVLAAKLSAAAKDRIFQAFCEQPGGVVQWNGPVYTHIHNTGGAGPNYPNVAVPSAATQVRVGLHNLVPNSAGVGPLQSGFYATGGSPGPVSFQSMGNGPTVETDRFVYTINGPGQIECAVYGSITWDAEYSMEWYGPSAATPHTATDQPPVIGAIPPTQRTYLTIPDLGKELDAQEYKLDVLRQTLSYLLQNVAPPVLSGPSIEPTSPTDTAPIVPVPAGSVAAVVTVSSIPAGADIEFTEPPRYARLGTITLGTSAGWLPSFHLEHTPQLVAPLPAWVTQVKVHCFAPATATVSFLQAL